MDKNFDEIISKNFDEIKKQVKIKLNKDFTTKNKFLNNPYLLSKIIYETYMEKEILTYMRKHYPDLLFDFSYNKDFIFWLSYRVKDEKLEKNKSLKNKYDDFDFTYKLYEIIFKKFLNQKEYDDEFIIIYDMFKEIKNNDN